MNLKNREYIYGDEWVGGKWRVSLETLHFKKTLPPDFMPELFKHFKQNGMRIHERT